MEIIYTQVNRHRNAKRSKHQKWPKKSEAMASVGARIEPNLDIFSCTLCILIGLQGFGFSL